MALSKAVTLFPTPTASDTTNRQVGNPVHTKNGTIRHRNKAGGQNFMRLSQVAKLFPTPNATLGTYDLHWQATDQRKKPNKLGWAVASSDRELFPTPTVHGNYNRRGVSSSSGDGLATIVNQYPTPTAQDAKNATLPPSQADRDSIPGHLLRAGIVGQLNPDWVDVLMGFPRGWSAGDQTDVSIETIQQLWRDGTWEDDISRVAIKIPDRAKRLRCLGNAIVPQCAVVIAAAVIAHYLRTRSFGRFRV